MNLDDHTDCCLFGKALAQRKPLFPDPTRKFLYIKVCSSGSIYKLIRIPQVRFYAKTIKGEKQWFLRNVFTKKTFGPLVMTSCSPGKPCNVRIHYIRFEPTVPPFSGDETFSLTKAHRDGSLCLSARLRLSK